MLIFPIISLTGCSQRVSNHGTSNTLEAGCVGKTIIAYGLLEVKNDNLLQQAQMPPGKGGLCKATVLEVKQPLTVYRVWDKSKPNTKFGRWWSFTPPAGPASSYQTDNDICPEWSTLNQVTQCRLKIGANIVVGPGQSAQCANDVIYPPSATNQVFVPNDTLDVNNINLLVEDCTTDATWP